MALQGFIPQLVLAFGAVLALMGLLAFAAKKFGVRGPTGSRSALQVQATLSLGSKEKLVVVEYAGQNYLLGVTASTITAISIVPPDAQQPALSAVDNSA